MKAITYMAFVIIGWAVVRGGYTFIRGAIAGWKVWKTAYEVEKMEAQFDHQPLQITIPEFVIDVRESKEDNLERLEEHIDEHAPEMSEHDRREFLEQFEELGVYEHGVQMQFHEDLERMDPEDLCD